MLSRQVARQASRLVKPSIISRQAVGAPFSTTQCARAETVDHDPDMNGGYINPPPIKRQLRDPYGDWTDKQERRNFGEPVHEDEDTLGIFSLEEYRAMSGSRGALMWCGFLGILGSLIFAVKMTYPDRPSAPKEYEGGLEAELGGPGAVRAPMAGDLVLGVKLDE